MYIYTESNDMVAVEISNKAWCGEFRALQLVYIKEKPGGSERTE